MYRTGHYGVALLAFAPIGLVLLLVAPVQVAVLAGLLVVGLTPVPDYDQRVPFVDHRGPTHTVAFALLVGCVTGGVGWVAGSGVLPAGPVAGAVVGFLAGTLAILAHLLGDVVTPAGITPFWPLSDAHYSAGLVRAANPVANYLLLGLGVAATVGVLWVGVQLGAL